MRSESKALGAEGDEPKGPPKTASKRRDELAMWLVGAVVAAVLLVTTVVALDPMFVYFDGDERTYLKYGGMARSGERPSSRDARNPVMVGIADEPGYPHEGYMDFVDNQIDPNTGTIQRTGGATSAATIAVPGRYAHTPAMIINLTDYANVIKLTEAALRSLTPETVKRS